MPAKVVGRFNGMVVYDESEALAYCVGERQVCRLAKPPLQVEQPEPSRWPADYFDGLLAALNDPLAEQVLAAGEPDFATVAALLPPLRDLGFLGDGTTVERLEIRPEGGVAGRDDLPSPAEGELVSAGLLDGWLPASVHFYRTETGPQELLQFARAAAGELQLWRRLKAGTGYGAIFHYSRDGAEVAAEEFYAQLLALWEHWRRLHRDGLKTVVPEPELQQAVRGMLTLAALTFRGLLPRYGVGCYDRPEHNSFPPAVLFLVEALLAWGHLARARETLDHYLSRYVKPDGTLDYYGPALAEYGQLLALVAQYVRLADDLPWLRQRLTLLRPLWQRLLALRAESLQSYQPTDCHYGLIPGLPEADYHDSADQWQTFYYSGDVWACRGLREIGRLLPALDEAGLHAEGAYLSAQADAYAANILASLQQAMAGDADFVPPGPDQTTPIQCLTADRHASYCNYRYLLEQVSAGLLPAELVRKVSAWRQRHGGELLGGTRFGDEMDDWPALHFARALLEVDEVDRYLLLLYSHWAHHCSQGLLSSYEQVNIRPDDSGTRRLRAGQVVPCQVMVPVMLRWGLVYEERDSDVLWLCRAIPRRWLATGGKVKAGRVPTRFGEVGFAVRRTTAEELEVKLRLPKGGLAAQLRLRLRLPEGEGVAEAKLGEEGLAVEGDTVLCPQGLAGKVRLTVRVG